MDAGVTVVTALYDIGRERSGDGRRFGQYLEWFQRTLSLSVAMVVFVDKCHAEFVEKCRSRCKCGTKIISEPFSKVPLYEELGRIRKIVRGQWVKNKMLSMPEYQVVIHSKFGWLKRAITKNPFQSRVFIWVDAGYGRFLKETDLNAEAWPNASWVQRISGSSRIWLQANVFRYLPDAVFRTAPIGWHVSCLMGGILCGNTEAMKAFCDKMHHFLFKEMLDKQKLDGEETVLSRLLVQDRKLFRTLLSRMPTLGSLMAQDIRVVAHKLKPKIACKKT
jgi:hypothetical protein